MIYVLYGTVNRETAPRQYIHDIDGYFDGYFRDIWITNEWANKVLKEIDKSVFISSKIVESPVLGTISHEWISGGSKQLIMMNMEQNVVYDGDNLGDNCWPLLLELGSVKDIMLSLSYYPMFKWVQGGELKVINNGVTVNDFESFNMSHLRTEDKNKEFEFTDVEWPIPIDINKFELEEIDF